ncbi:MAG: hypothetical protein WEB06_12510 [Actinomycetota bacterium]
MDPRGSGAFTFRARYGVGPLSDAIGYTCLGGSGRGRVSFTFPVEGGETLSLQGSLNWVRAVPLLVTYGRLGPTRWVGPDVFRPVKGDCVTEPITVGSMTGLFTFGE